MKSAPDSVPEASASNPRSQRPLADPSRWARPPTPAAAATPSWRISADPSPASRLKLTSAASPDRLAAKLNWAPPATPSALIESSPGAFGSADHACSVALAGESASARAASQRLAPPGATRPTRVATSSSFSRVEGDPHRAPLRPEGGARLDRGAAKPGKRQFLQREIVAGLGQFQRQRAAFEPGVARPTDPQLRRLQRQRQIGVADQPGAGVEIGQRVDVERVAAQVREQARAFVGDRRGVGDRAGERRTVQRQIEVAGRKSRPPKSRPLRSPKRSDRAAPGSARRGGSPIRARRASPSRATAQCRRAGPATRP